MLTATLACVRHYQNVTNNENKIAANANTSVSNVQPTPREAETVIVDVPKLMRKPPVVFEKYFGKSTEVSEWMHRGIIVGEIRHYALPQPYHVLTADGLRVDFYHGKAVSMLLILDSAGKCDKALHMLNINYSNTAQCEEQANYHDMKCVYFADKFGSDEIIQARICPVFYDTGPSGKYQILLQVDSPATKDPLE